MRSATSRCALGRGRVARPVGQNGAGKSTLMNIIGGVVQPDSGAMRLDGVALRARKPGRCAAAAASPSSIRSSTSSPISRSPRTSSSTAFPSRRFGPLALIDRAALAARTARAARRRSILDLAPDTPVERLSPGERQLVEVAKALQLDAAIIIFDEPTTSLTARETERLFALIGRLREVRQVDHLHLAHPRRRHARSPTTSRSCATASWSAAGPARRLQRSPA